MPATDVKTYSQIGQDVAVANWFKWKREGTFVDVGAYDGEHFSNSAMLERSLGWYGVCVEPLPAAFQALSTRRTAHCFQAAAYSNEGHETFRAADVLSGIDRHIGPRWQDETSRAPRVEVRTRTLASILVECGMPREIDYLSIDTEGSELEVLVGVDWSKYVFGYLTIEHNEVAEARRAIRDFLQTRGYEFLRQNQWDDDYVRAR